VALPPVEMALPMWLTFQSHMTPPGVRLTDGTDLSLSRSSVGVQAAKIASAPDIPFEFTVQSRLVDEISASEADRSEDP